MASSTSHPLPPLLLQPKVLGTARFKRSEIVSKAASKRSFCVSCEARSQALPPRGTIFDGWHGCLGSLPCKNGGFHCPMKERTNYSSHPSRKVHHIIWSWMLLDFGINHEDFWMEVIGFLFPDVFFPTPTWAMVSKSEKNKLLDKGLSMLRHTQMFGRNLGFACYKWLEKITKIFPKWSDALMMIYRGRNLKKYLATNTRNVFTSWWSFGIGHSETPYVGCGPCCSQLYNLVPWSRSLPSLKTNIKPWSRPYEGHITQKKRIVSQPPFFRACVSFKECGTFPGGTPTPVSRLFKTPLFAGFYPRCEVVQDFFHQLLTSGPANHLGHARCASRNVDVSTVRSWNSTNASNSNTSGVRKIHGGKFRVYWKSWNVDYPPLN